MKPEIAFLQAEYARFRATCSQPPPIVSTQENISRRKNYTMKKRVVQNLAAKYSYETNMLQTWLIFKDKGSSAAVALRQVALKYQQQQYPMCVVADSK